MNRNSFLYVETPQQKYPMKKNQGTFFVEKIPRKIQKLGQKSSLSIENWLVVSTHLKNIRQNGFIFPKRAAFFLRIHSRVIGENPWV